MPLPAYRTFCYFFVCLLTSFLQCASDVYLHSDMTLMCFASCEVFFVLWSGQKPCDYYTFIIFKYTLRESSREGWGRREKERGRRRKRTGKKSKDKTWITALYAPGVHRKSCPLPVSFPEWARRLSVASPLIVAFARTQKTQTHRQLPTLGVGPCVSSGTFWRQMYIRSKWLQKSCDATQEQHRPSLSSCRIRWQTEWRPRVATSSLCTYCILPPLSILSYCTYCRFFRHISY